MNLIKNPATRTRSGKRGEGQSATRDRKLSTAAGNGWQDVRERDVREREAAAVLDRPPARRKAGQVASLLALLDHLPPAREEMESEVRK